MFINFINSNKDIFYYKVLERSLSGCKSVLDVGCGANSPLREVKSISYSEGVDIFRKSIAESKKRKIHDEYKIGNILDIDKFYKQKSFDAVVALDVVEHLTKSGALKLIKKMEKIARRKIIIMTPNGFYLQDELDENPYQIHKSGWVVNDFDKLGFRTFGIRGLKYLRGELASIRYKPWVFWGLLAFISEPLLHFFPKISYQLIAIKNVDEK